MTVHTDEELIGKAAAWFMRLRESDDDSARVELRQWLALDVRHVAAMDVVERGWRRADALALDASVRFSSPRSRPISLQTRRPRTSTGKLAWAAGLAASILLSLSLLVGAEHRGIGFGAPRTFSTLGSAQTITLTDGSLLRLQPHSWAIVRQSLFSRQVVLRTGQAEFTVAHESSRPFVVHAGPIGVEATGTRFSVGRDAAGTHVKLWEGGVRVRDRTTGAVLADMTPGDRADAFTGGGVMLTHSRPVARVFVFADTSLADAVAQIAMGSGLRTRFARPELAHLPINSVYHGDDLPAFLDDLQTVEPICWRLRDATIEIYDKFARCERKPSLR